MEYAVFLSPLRGVTSAYLTTPGSFVNDQWEILSIRPINFVGLELAKWGVFGCASYLISELLTGHWEQGEEENRRAPRRCIVRPRSEPYKNTRIVETHGSVGWPLANYVPLEIGCFNSETETKRTVLKGGCLLTYVAGAKE